MADLIQQYGPIFGRLAQRREQKQLNPMREALLQTLPYDGPMASPESQQAAESMSPQQQMIASAAHDPAQFATLARQAQGGPLGLAEMMSQKPRERDVVVHPGDQLNTDLKLGLKDQESATVKLSYDQHDRLQPGFTIGTYKTTNDNTDPARTGRAQYPGGAVGRVLLTNDIRIANGQPPLTPQETEKVFQDSTMTSAQQQAYRQYRDQQIASGVPERDVMDMEDWTPRFGAQIGLASAVGPETVKRLSAYQEKATAAIPAMRSIEQAYQLIDTGLIAGAAAEPRLALVRAIDTMLGRTTDAKSAATDAYLAASGQRVAEAITSFGAGTGLSDADRDFARMITAGKIDMTPQALRMALEILARGKLGDVSNYNQRLESLSGDAAYLKSFYEKVVPPESIYGRISPLAKAPEGSTDDQKLAFYLNQRPSYLPQGANQQLPPNGGSGPVPGQNVIQYDAQGNRVQR